jgi:hypothetical protein
VIEEHVVVRTQTEDVIRGVRSAVRGSERPDVRGFRVRTGKTF